MIEFLNQLKEKFQIIKNQNNNQFKGPYIEEYLLDKTINELKWENYSNQEKQNKRFKILAIIEAPNVSNENYKYTGYERKVVEFYDSLMRTKNEIENMQLDIELESLLALILIEMRSIDKNARMKNIVHIDQAIFMTVIKRCQNKLKTGDQLIKELEKLHTNPTI